MTETTTITQACQAIDCPHAGQWAVKLCVPHVGYENDPRPWESILGVRFCRRHVEDFKASQIIDVATPNGTSTFRETFGKVLSVTRGPVDFDRAYIVPLRVSSEEFATFERLTNRP